MNYLKVIVLITVLLSSIVAHAQLSTVEYQVTSSKTLPGNLYYGVYTRTGFNTDSCYTVFLLHGLGGSYKSFFYKGLQKAMDSLYACSNLPPLRIITPDGKRSYFMDSADSTYLWETWFMNEFLTYLSTQHIIDTSRCIMAGFSMGGFGALNLNVKYPQLKSCIAISPAVRNDRILLSLSNNAYNNKYAKALGPNLESLNRITEHWKKNNIFYQLNWEKAKQLKNTFIYISCGDDDFLNPGVSLAHLILYDYGIAHEFRIYNGSHNWDYFMPSFSDGLLTFFSTHYSH